MDLNFQEANDFLEQLELLQATHAANSSNDFKKEFGQFFTSKNIANFMSSLLKVKGESYRVLDSCAGLGILSISTIFFLIQKKVKKIHLDAYEIDICTAKKLEETLNRLKENLEIEFSYQVYAEDFLLKDLDSEYDITVINPPYFKLSKDSKYRINKNGLIKKSPNIYSSFLNKSLHLLKKEGQLVFITPRSFTNGSNFDEFRNNITTNNSIDYIHLFNSRVEIFKNDNIRQENVIFKITKDVSQKDILISNSNCIEQLDFEHLKPQKYSSKLVLNQFSKKVIAIPEDKKSMELYLDLLKLEKTFTEHGYRISTGKIVQFRDKNVTDVKLPNSILIYNSQHISSKHLDLIVDNDSKKNKFYIINSDHKKWLIPNQNYIFLRRISVKESKHRIALGIYYKNNTSELVAVENHLNYIYHADREISKLEIVGLANYLKSESVNNYFSIISGVTQINASDIRDLPIPTKAYLEELALSYEGSADSSSI